MHPPSQTNVEPSVLPESSPVTPESEPPLEEPLLEDPLEEPLLDDPPLDELPLEEPLLDEPPASALPLEASSGAAPSRGPAGFEGPPEPEEHAGTRGAMTSAQPRSAMERAFTLRGYATPMPSRSTPETARVGAWVRRCAPHRPFLSSVFRAGTGIAPAFAMRVQSVLRTLAILPVPLFLACGGGSSGGGNATPSDGGAQGSVDAPSGVTPDGGKPATDAGGVVTPTDSGSTTPEAGDDAGGNVGTDAGAPDAGPIAVPTTKAVMYLDNWSGSFASWATKIDFTKLTHLNLAFATVSGNSDWGTSLGSTSDVQAIVAAAHAKNVKVLASLGGGGGDQSVIGAYKTASNIGPLVANLDAMVSAMNLDGVDVDLESPGDMTSGGNYPAFIKALIATFHPEGKLVTTAEAQYIAQGQNTDAAVVEALNSFDFVNDMIYSATVSDFTNEAGWWTGSPVNLPKDKLVWGVCFDGECANPSVSTVKQLTTMSKDYGGIMIWDYTDGSVGPTMWPAIQSQL